MNGLLTDITEILLHSTPRRCLKSNGHAHRANHCSEPALARLCDEHDRIAAPATVDAVPDAAR